MRIFFTLASMSGLLLFNTTTFAADIENGKTLYEANCTRCHGSEIFQRSNRMVNTKEQLIERIKQCELSNELAWFEEEITDVSAYLVQEFYRFDDK